MIALVVGAVLLAAALGGLLALRRPLLRSSGTYPAIGTVDVRLGGGRVEVLGQDRSDVRVEATVRGGVGRPRPVLTVADGVLTVDGRRSEARYQLRVPRLTAVRAEVRAGEVTLWGARGDLALVTETGTIAGRELGGGRVLARSSGGAVSLQFAESPAEVVARSVAGDVRVVLPGGPYAVEVETANTVEVEVPADASAPRRVTATSRTGAVHVLPVAKGPVRL